MNQTLRNSISGHDRRLLFSVFAISAVVVWVSGIPNSPEFVQEEEYHQHKNINTFQCPLNNKTLGISWKYLHNVHHRPEWLGKHDKEIYSSYCNIPKVRIEDLTREEFKSLYLESHPVVIVTTDIEANGGNPFHKPYAVNRSIESVVASDKSNLAKFIAATQRQRLLEKYGKHQVTLSSANKNSYDKKKILLEDYINDNMAKKGQQTVKSNGNDTWYYFGDNKHDEWQDTFDLYPIPWKYIFGPYASLSFGIGVSGSGVPFHTHGHVFAEVLHGHKRWFLSPYEYEPPYDPNASSLQWFKFVYPSIRKMSSKRMNVLSSEIYKTNKNDVDGNNDYSDVSLMKSSLPTKVNAAETEQSSDDAKIRSDSDTSNNHSNVINLDKFFDCTLGVGELLYIPTRWHHATLNIGESVFMSTFV
eukprot:Tbor_TRINITY_DN4598_c0_g2::TRINITY_DN4598_c0_g2_i2::g.15763::m.15763